MRSWLSFYGLVGLGLLARGIYALFGLQSENQIGLETMTAVEIGFGLLVMLTAVGFTALLEVLQRGGRVVPISTREIVPEASTTSAAGAN